MKPISRLVGALALAAVITPTAFGGDAELQPARYTSQPMYSPSTTSPGRLPMSASTPSKPYVVRPVYVVSVGTRNGSADSAVRAAKNTELTQELVNILNETKSPDVLLITVETLAELKAEPRLVIPAIIRNSERLNLLEGICTSETRNGDQKKILEALEYFTKRTRKVIRSKKSDVPTTSYSPGFPGAHGDLLAAAEECESAPDTRRVAVAQPSRLWLFS